MVQNAGSPGLTQKGFMSKWAYLTMTNPKAALAHLLYIGIPLDKQTMQQQFSVSRPRSIERKKPRDQQCRTVFQVSMLKVFVLHNVRQAFHHPRICHHHADFLAQLSSTLPFLVLKAVYEICII